MVMFHGQNEEELLLDSLVYNWPNGCHGQPSFGQLYFVDGDFTLHAAR